MKKIITLVLALAMTVSLCTACGSTKDSSSEKATTKAASTIDMTGIKLLNEGTLTVGAEMSYPPFEDFAEDGKTAEGFDIDIIGEVARRLGLKFNFINTGFDGIFAGIEKNYDCVCSAVTINAERKKTMIFSTPYTKSYQMVITKVGSKLKIGSFKDLAGKTIAVQKETTSDILMSDLKSTGSVDMKIVANEKVPNCFSQLDNGEVDAVVVDSPVGDGYVAKNPKKYQNAYTDKSQPEEFGIAFNKSQTALQKAVNQALADMEKDGFIDETYSYWFEKK